MKQSEIWIINLDPTSGAEIKKTRPAVIVNDYIFERLPLKIIVPLTELTDWKERYSLAPWMNLWYESRGKPRTPFRLKQRKIISNLLVRRSGTRRRIKIEPNNLNGLEKTSTIDCFQVRSISDQRFIKQIGKINNDLLEQIKNALAKVFSFGI